MPTNGIDGGQAVEVNIGDCRCPGDPRPHPDGDVVWMRPRPDLAMALAARGAMSQSSNLMGEASAAVFSVYIRHGVIRWNITDDAGKLAPVTFDAILDRMSQWNHGGEIVADKSILLYHELIFSPPQTPRPNSQPPTPSSGSTSRKPPSGRPPRNSSRRSSPSARVATT